MHTPVYLFFVAITSATGAWAQLTDPSVITASDAAFDDRFGSAIAVEGAKLFVAAPRHDEHGSNAGLVYVYDVATGEEIDRLNPIPAGGATNDRFGSSITARGSTVLIGAIYDDMVVNDGGAAYLFNHHTGALIRRVAPADLVNEDYFGASVALSDEVAVVGAPSNQVLATAAPGAVYLFSAADGEFLSTIEPGFHLDQRVGEMVAIEGSLLAVGAPGRSSTTHGKVYLYDVNDPREPVWLSEIAYSVGRGPYRDAMVMSGGLLYISHSRTEEVLVYDVSSASVPELVVTISKPAPSPASSIFGTSMAISGSRLAVTERAFHTVSPRAWVYDMSEPAFPQLMTEVQTASDLGWGSDACVAIDGSTVFVGDPTFTRDSDSSVIRHGAVSSFELPFHPACPADFAPPSGVLNFFDVSAFVAAFLIQSDQADFNNDGSFDFFDFSEFLAEYQSGCE